MKAVAGDLLKVGQEDGATVMIDEDRGVVEDFFVKFVSEVKTKFGVFTGPEFGVKAIDGEEVFFFDE